MKLYYSFALQQLIKNHEKYKQVIDLIKAEGNTLTREWLQDAVDRMIINIAQPSRADMYADIMEAIKNADACIFDVSVKSMSIGHQINYALQRRKPTLVISDSRKSDPVSSLLISGSKSGYLHTKDYKNEKEMLEIVSSFLNNKSIHEAPLRLNLFLEKSHADYVDETAHKKNITKTEVIANALETAIKNDEEYKKHLQSKV